MFNRLMLLFTGALLGCFGYYLGSKSSGTVAKQNNTFSQEERVNNNVIKGYALPERMSFAEEEVPLHRADVQERIDREIQINAFWHSNSIILMKRAGLWLPKIDSILTANDIPSDFKYLAIAESGLTNVVSSAKAVGFWQLLKGTAKDFGLIVNNQIDQRYDPILSTLGAIKYLKKAKERFGTWTLVAVSYNMGMSGTASILEKQKAETYYDMVMSEEPSRYVPRILALKYLFENLEQFGFSVKNAYQRPNTREVKIDQSIDSWVDFCEKNGTTYYYLKRLNPWIRAHQLDLKQGQTIAVELPV